MVIEDIQKFWFEKLLFPKKIIVDKPGIIINERYTSNKITNKIRMVFYFEKIFVDLQKETIKKIGKEKTSELWYKIGKDVGIRYMLLGRVKKVPNIILPLTLNYIFKGFSSAGFSVTKKVIYDKNKEEWIFQGNQNLLCNKTGIGDVFSGILSSSISFMKEKNFEGKLLCKDCPNKCKIIISNKIPFKYKPNLDELKPLNDYIKLNFPRFMPQTELSSLSDLLKFKKAEFDKIGKINFKGEIISLADFGFIGLIQNNYLKENYIFLFEKSINKSSKNLASNLLKDYKIEEKIKILKNILCAFGWGIPSLKKDKENITIIIHNPPRSKYAYTYIIFLIKGFLEYIFKKNFKAIIEKDNINEPLIITYK